MVISMRNSEERGHISGSGFEWQQYQNASKEQNYQVTPENNQKEKRRRQLVYNNFETSLNEQYWQ
jgi:hypothetical protein